MINLSSCIEMMFDEFPFEKRIEAAKDAGFSAWEMWNWSNRDIAAIAEVMKKINFPAAACCIGTRDAEKSTAWQKGNMLLESNAALFAEMVEETIIGVKALGIKTFIATTGNTLADVSMETQEQAIISCLTASVPILKKYGCNIVLEPLNILVNHMGYYLSTSKQGFEIIKQVDSENVKLLYDVYHQQITEGNLIDTINENIHAIGHFHIADVPGRYEPGTGEINYKNVFAAISKSGYSHCVGCEYRPSPGKTTVESAKDVLNLAKLFKIQLRN